jgi:hypothetical protein
MPAKIRPSLTVLQALRTEQGGWMTLAECRGMDADLFFPMPGKGYNNPVEVQLAKAVCAQCPVSGPCLGYALPIGEMWLGGWGRPGMIRVV